ncbi:uncharacterized protein LOC134823995 [Bolinopsis microptera]|uniref:uncharacterized protein LOC134823995 n=1 Tax=Bolinopsis microptera TaxID=2820187 RepID=UPI0030795F70
MMTVDGAENLDENSVYEQLAAIRSAFEDLIDRYGYSAIEVTMNKVVSVLEQFEALTSSKRQSRLRIVNAELALEEEREAHMHQQQLSHCRVQELQAQNTRLMEENGRLLGELQSSTIQLSDVNLLKVREKEKKESDSEVLNKLNDVISVQTTTLHELREEYEELNMHSSKQSALILKLKAGLQDSVHSQKVLQARNDTLCNELATLEAQLAVHELNHPESDDVTRPRSDSYTQSDDRSSWDSLEETRTAKHEDMQEDKDIQRAKSDYKRSAAQVIREVLSSYSPTVRRRKVNKCTCEQNGYKFTVEEMTLLINERNIAKEKLVAVEEDLTYFRERDGVEEMTDEGFAILDPPRASTTGTITRTLFQRVSRSEQDT